MTEKTRILYYALWIAHPLLQTGIAAVMFRRGLHRKFKFFFTYILAQILTFAIIFPTHASSYFYLYFFWFSNAVSVGLGFAMIHEIFMDVFRPFHTLRDLGSVLFKWAGLVMLLVAAVVSVSTKSGEMAPWMQAILTSQRCVRIIQVGMVLFLLFFARYLGVSRREPSFGIALGFGIFAGTELLLLASLIGNYLSVLSVDLVNMAAYNVSLMVWLGYAYVKSPARDIAAVLLQPQRWEESLTDIHRHPLPADSLIPMFEGMVDRALSRTQDLTPIPALPASQEKTQSVSVRAAAAAASDRSEFTILGSKAESKV
ncbi:MAG TPA: hypothetical protein VFO39_12990 [Candidatus Sulfotelmatobacter sp.]|nr:hypothetical protein [Candidatus Sulfotelmatobacter sp.]